MSKTFWKAQEYQQQPLDLAATLPKLNFNQEGLIAAIAQQHDTGEVLMLAWMNLEAIQTTLAEGRVCYWSRSRQQLWRKGETSGQMQTLVSMAIDCDGDALLLQVDQTGPACHTGRRHCFFHQVDRQQQQIHAQGEVLIDAQTLYGHQ